MLSQADADSDSVGDACDLCPGTPAGTPVDVTGCPLGPCANFWKAGGIGLSDFQVIA